MPAAKKRCSLVAEASDAAGKGFKTEREKRFRGIERLAGSKNVRIVRTGYELEFFID